jgi:hypothetical protein
MRIWTSLALSRLLILVIWEGNEIVHENSPPSARPKLGPGDAYGRGFTARQAEYGRAQGPLRWGYDASQQLHGQTMQAHLVRSYPGMWHGRSNGIEI